MTKAKKNNDHDAPEIVMKPLTRKYRRGEITVTHQPRRCTHVGECLRRAPNVFDAWNQP